jgi:hypothetical protein
VQVQQSSGGLGVDLRAHGSTLACLAMSADGRLLATASSKGTLVRVFSADDGIKLQEVCIYSDKHFYFLRYSKIIQLKILLLAKR